MRLEYCDEGFYVDTDKPGVNDGEGTIEYPEVDLPDDVNDEIERLREALREYENADNWFDTSDEAGGPYPAWRGDGEPEDIARRALEGGGEDD